MIIPSYFNQLAQSVDLQFLLDNSQDNLTTPIWQQWLDVAVPQFSLNFDMAIGRDRIAAAASIVDSDAPAPLRSRNKLELYKGKIPAIKEKFAMRQSDMRDLMVLQNLPLQGANRADAMIRFLNKDLVEAATSGDKRLDLMLLQSVSTLSVDLSTTNNPDGIAVGTIDLLPQSYQKQGVPIVWTDLTNATPIDDIENFLEINWSQRGRMFGSLKMSQALWYVFKRTAQVQKYIAGYFNLQKTTDSFAVTLVNVNEFMVSNGWPTIEIVNNVTNIEVDGKATFVRGFNANNVSFTPAGKFGTLFNAICMEETNPVAGKSYAKYGSTLVSKWCESDPLTEYTAMELNAFPAINIDGVFVLTTDTVQSTFN